MNLLQPQCRSFDLQQLKGASGGFFGRLISGLGKTRASLSEGLGSIILGSKTIDAGLLEEVETTLLSADVGMEATDHIIDSLKQKLNRRQLTDPEQFLVELKNELATLLQPCAVPLSVDTKDTPFVLLVVGVNGVGKTTTIGKVCKYFQSQGLKPM